MTPPKRRSKRQAKLRGQDDGSNDQRPTSPGQEENSSSSGDDSSSHETDKKRFRQHNHKGTLEGAPDEESSKTTTTKEQEVKKAVQPLTNLIDDIQTETENFEDIVQGKGISSVCKTPVQQDSMNASRTISGIKDQLKSTPMKSTPGSQLTLFQHGFKPCDLTKSSLKQGVPTEAKKSMVNPYPSQEEQDEYVKKHGEENFVSGIGFNLMKVEPGTFARMDAGDSNNPTESDQTHRDEEKNDDIPASQTVEESAETGNAGKSPGSGELQLNNATDGDQDGNEER